jgi:hypothetical protein
MAHPERPAQQETEARSPAPPASPGHDALALFAFLAGPMAWSLDLLLSYFLVPHEHWAGSKGWMHAVTVLTAAVAVAGAVAAVRILRSPAATARRVEGRVAERSRFLAIGGIALCAFFFLAIVAQAVPKFLLSTRD